MGYIYTAQGFEYDYSGVIFGPDLVWRDGVWITTRRPARTPSWPAPASTSSRT
ncbi:MULTISPECIES: DNA/RNA helicase domain-containing protein [unclassified Streptomyces]|uniref:DNA/RNA helicase domain-containing protein n=1 Tax=Streptomyces sp. NBC_00723 TaxID=2903673 RepID=UPI00386AD51E